MDALHTPLLFLHLLGMALIVGPWAVAVLEQKFTISTAMVIGAATQLATGIMLPGALGADADHAKLGVKALLTILLAIMIVIPWFKKRDPVNSGHYYAIGALSVITVAVAVFW